MYPFAVVELENRPIAVFVDETEVNERCRTDPFHSVWINRPKQFFTWVVPIEDFPSVHTNG